MGGGLKLSSLARTDFGKRLAWTLASFGVWEKYVSWMVKTHLWGKNLPWNSTLRTQNKRRPPSGLCGLARQCFQFALARGLKGRRMWSQRRGPSDPPCGWGSGPILWHMPGFWIEPIFVLGLHNRVSGFWGRCPWKPTGLWVVAPCVYMHLPRLALDGCRRGFVCNSFRIHVLVSSK